MLCMSIENFMQLGWSAWGYTGGNVVEYHYSSDIPSLME